jgi:hypothetical protein
MPKLRLVPGGINEYVDLRTGKTIQTHSSTCFHCQTLSEFESLRRMFDSVDICRSCMKLICLGCVGKPCMPFEKRAELMELEHRLQRQAWGCY